MDKIQSLIFLTKLFIYCFFCLNMQNIFTFAPLSAKQFFALNCPDGGIGRRASFRD